MTEAASVGGLASSDETIFPSRRSRPETRIRSDSQSIKQRGAIMLGHIINLIYRVLCRQYLNAMRRQHRWA
jgi:hypothetical protein